MGGELSDCDAMAGVDLVLTFRFRTFGLKRSHQTREHPQSASPPLSISPRAHDRRHEVETQTHVKDAFFLKVGQELGFGSRVGFVLPLKLLLQFRRQLRISCTFITTSHQPRSLGGR